MAFLTTSFKPWAIGRAVPINCISSRLSSAQNFTFQPVSASGCYGALIPPSPVCGPSSLQARWRGGELPLAGSRSQGRHGNLLAVPHTCTGPSPTFHGTSSQAHLLAMSLTVSSISASFLTYLLEQRVFKRCLLYSCPAISPPQSAKPKNNNRKHSLFWT